MTYLSRIMLPQKECIQFFSYFTNFSYILKACQKAFAVINSIYWLVQIMRKRK